MNIFTEVMSKKYPGNYRGQIVSIDNENKNGIYKVKVYPMFADIEEQYLPPAFSNMTNKDENISLAVNDWVWIFFENSNPRFPIIWDRCNVKNEFPKGSDGTQADWFSDIQPNNDINETTIAWEAQYPTVFTKDFGDNVHFFIDEKNQVIIIKTDKGYFVFDKNGDFHFNIDKLFGTISANFNIEAQNMKLKIGNNEILAENGDILINNNLKILNT